MGARAAHSVAPPPPGKLEAGEKFVQRLEGQERSSKQAAREEDERPQVRASGRVDLKPPPGRQKRPQLQPPVPVAARAALGLGKKAARAGDRGSVPPARAAVHLSAVRPRTRPAGFAKLGSSLKKRRKGERKKNPRSGFTDPFRCPSGSPSF